MRRNDHEMAEAHLRRDARRLHPFEGRLKDRAPIHKPAA